MENQKELEKDCHVYLYCFFKGPAAFLPQAGIDEKHDTFLISHKDICALVSSVSADEYSEDILNERLQDLKWLPPKVKHHQDMIDYAMDFHPVIPVRFGTIYENAERVLQILSNGYQELCSCLDFVSDKAEWGIKVYAEEGACRSTIQASSAAVAELDKQISSTSSTPSPANPAAR